VAVIVVAVAVIVAVAVFLTTVWQSFTYAFFVYFICEKLK